MAETEARTGWQLSALGSAYFAALTAVLGKVGVSGVNSNLATLIRTVVILSVTAGIVSARGEWEPLGRLSRVGVVMLVLSGVAIGLSWLCYNRALLVAPVDKLSVALVIVFAAVFLGERLTVKVALGGLLVVAGVLVLAGA